MTCRLVAKIGKDTTPVLGLLRVQERDRHRAQNGAVRSA